MEDVSIYDLIFDTSLLSEGETIKTLKDILKKKRKATRKEQEVLSKYVGWGGMSQVFDYLYGDKQQKYGKKQDELKELLTEDEYDSASASTINAHFTSPTLINAMWKIVGKLGLFK